MKKLFALALVVLGLAACQTDHSDLDVQFDGNATITLSIPADAVTRAGGSDSAASGLENTEGETLRFILEIYDEYGDKKIRETQYANENTLTANFPVRLVPGRKYTLVAWADMVTTMDENNNYLDNHYITSNGLTEITLNGNWDAMDETRDAFTASKTITEYSSTENLNMQLTRPFAKLRVIATDVEALKELGLEAKKVTIAFNGKVANSYNAFNQEVASTDTRDEFTFDIAEYGDSKDGKLVLYTDYIFANEEQDAVKFSLTTLEESGREIKTVNFNTDIAVKRNTLTTLTGNVMTEGNNIEVTVDKEFGNAQNPEDAPYYNEIVEVGNAADLQEAINNSTEETMIVLGGDIVLGDEAIELAATRAEADYALLVPAGKVVNLNLNGKTISQVKECTGNYSMILNKGNLTITGNGKISFNDTGAGDPSFGWGSYTLRNEGTLVVENGTIEHLGKQNPGNGQPNVHMYCAIFQYSGTSTINGGTISTPTYRSARLWNGEMTINGGNFEGQLWLQAVSDNAKLTIKGGRFAPRGNDGSSVFVSNSGKSVECAISGGYFEAKVGMSEPFACITGGIFTTVAKDGTNSALINDDYTWAEAENGNWKLVRKGDVAKIGEDGYTSLQKAVAAVQDGDTITLVADEVFTEQNYYDNDGWKDGLGYAGDKSFTIDLGGFTIRQNGALNDYLIWIKNDGSKANTITLKNGTLDAGKTAYCAFATSSSNAQKITINLENINLVGNNSNGAVAKIRGGAELNVKAGTVITGNNNYVGIECVNSTTNIYEGAKIYQKGTSSSWGCLVGVSGNGVVNVYGGNGTSARGGFMAMTSGGTINVAGGEWIANTDGTYANDNKGVLIAQSDKKYNAGAGNSVINVTGGTFKGGYNCYGNAVGDAQINIKGGNFNADPASYLAEGCEATEANGVWTVRFVPATRIGETEYNTLQEAFNVGGDITLLRNITVSEAATLAAGKTAVLDLNGFTIYGAEESTVKHIYAIKNYGSMTIKDTKGNGSIDSRGIYNYGTMTLNSGKISAIDGNGGYAVNNQSGSTFVMNGGWIAADYEDGDAPASGNYDATALNIPSNATATLNGGKITNAGNFTYAIASAGTLNIPAESTLTVEGRHGTVSINGGETTINAGTYSIPTNTEYTDNVVYVYGSGKLVINGGTFIADKDIPNGGCCVCDAIGGATINGGVFGNSSGGDVWGKTGTVIKGGKFENLTETSHIADGYKLNENGEVVAQ